MQFIKAALLLAAILLAPQSHSFDLPNQILKAFESYNANQVKPARANKSAPSANAAMPAATGNFGECCRRPKIDHLKA